MSENDNDKIKKRYDRIAPLYDVMELLMEKGKMGDWRKKLWEKVAVNIPESGGTLLEAGVGTGKNIQYYPDDIEIYAIDFSEKMLKQAKSKAEKYEKNIIFKKMDIQNLVFLDNYFDVIVTSCVFCSVPDPVIGLKELKRVCKTNGKIIMLEHMRTKNEPWGKVMDNFNWVSLYTWGANINRKTMDNIEKADLNVVKVNDLFFDIVKEIVLEP
ncbi:MAG: methyltransferase domain-containing protein [Halanaerobiales bacterium]